MGIVRRSLLIPPLFVVNLHLKINIDLWGSSCCRYLIEHGLKPDGRPDPEMAAAADVAADGSFDTFFSETASGKYVPRSIFVDLDPSVCSS